MSFVDSNMVIGADLAKGSWGRYRPLLSGPPLRYISFEQCSDRRGGSHPLTIGNFYHDAPCARPPRPYRSPPSSPHIGQVDPKFRC